MIFGLSYGVLALIAAIGSAIASGVMAVFTYRLGSTTRTLAIETKRSVMAEVEGVERAKDALMPVLRFRITVFPPGQEPSIEGAKLLNILTEGQFASYAVSVENIGTGPGFLQEVTARDEVDVSEVYGSPLRTSVIRVGEVASFVIKGDQHRSFRSDYDRVSSWSLWYTDVYARWYRSRMVVLYPRARPGAPPASADATVLCSETQQHIKPIVATYGYPTEATYMRRYENGVQHRGVLNRDWYTLAAVGRLKGKVMSGCRATRGRESNILDMGFWLHERDPVFTVQVGDHPPFVIGRRQGEHKLEVVLKNAQGFILQALSGVVSFASFGSKELDLGAWGLYDQVASVESTFEEFYNEIYEFARTVIVAGTPNETRAE